MFSLCDLYFEYRFKVAYYLEIRTISVLHSTRILTQSQFIMQSSSDPKLALILSIALMSRNALLRPSLTSLGI